MTAPGSSPSTPSCTRARSDLDDVLDQVRRSTVDKAAEIVRAAPADRAPGRGPAGRLRQGHGPVRSLGGGRLFAFGNGGSSTDAQAVATTFLHPRPGGRPLPALSLTDDVAVVTALANDVGFDVVFARQLAAFGRPGDIAVGLSTSGNSDNLVRAFEEASRRGLLTIGLAGYQGGKMAELDTIDYLFVVPSSSVHRIQEAQTTVYHVLWELTQVALEASDGS